MPHGDIGLRGGGHPLDLQRRRMPPGAAVCPLPQHPSQLVVFVFPASTMTVGTGNGATQDFGPGDIVLPPPGTAQQVRNTGAIFALIAAHYAADSTYYPDSDKWQLKPSRKVFRMVKVNYFDGEE